jgi:hypothetical protein
MSSTQSGFSGTPITIVSDSDKDDAKAAVNQSTDDNMSSTQSGFSGTPITVISDSDKDDAKAEGFSDENL